MKTTYAPQKRFAPITIYSLYLKLWEYVTLPNVKKIVWNNTEILYRYVETNTFFLIHSTIIFEIPKSLILNPI